MCKSPPPARRCTAEHETTGHAHAGRPRAYGLHIGGDALERFAERTFGQPFPAAIGAALPDTGNGGTFAEGAR